MLLLYTLICHFFTSISNNLFPISTMHVRMCFLNIMILSIISHMWHVGLWEAVRWLWGGSLVDLLLNVFWIIKWDQFTLFYVTLLDHRNRHKHGDGHYNSTCWWVMPKLFLASFNPFNLRPVWLNNQCSPLWLNIGKLIRWILLINLNTDDQIQLGISLIWVSEVIWGSNGWVMMAALPK